MGLLANLALVFLAGLVTALATGIGALPFFFEDINDRWNGVLWGPGLGHHAGGVLLVLPLRSV